MKSLVAKGCDERFNYKVRRLESPNLSTETIVNFYKCVFGCSSKGTNFKVGRLKLYIISQKQGSGWPGCTPRVIGCFNCNTIAFSSYNGAFS